MRISDWSSYVCSSDLIRASRIEDIAAAIAVDIPVLPPSGARERVLELRPAEPRKKPEKPAEPTIKPTRVITSPVRGGQQIRSEEHTYALQSLMRISHAVCCFKKQKQTVISNRT